MIRPCAFLLETLIFGELLGFKNLFPQELHNEWGLKSVNKKVTGTLEWQ